MLFCLLVLVMMLTGASAVNNAPGDQNSGSFESAEISGYTEKANQPEETRNAAGMLPSSLIRIEESAFEGTALSAVELSPNLQIIDDYAFANIKTLKVINLPASVTYIGKNAFAGSDKVILTGIPGSYSRAWARENGIPFHPIAGLYGFNTTVHVTGLSDGKAELQKLIPDEESTEEQKQRPTGRLTGDLNADRFEELTAFHIQGRSPPMG